MASSVDGVDRNVPLLPIITANVNALRTAEQTADTRPLMENWQEKYKAADKRLCALEEELDCLLHCSTLLREQRVRLMQNCVTYSDTFPHERTMPEENANQLVDQYLALFQKSQGIDNAVQKVKDDCRLARTECSWLFARARILAEGGRSKGEGGAVGNEVRGIVAEFVHQDMWGAMDSDFAFKRPLEVRTRVREIGAVIGTLGAGTTYSTLLSANRGRLDLVSWAFVAFVLLLLHSVLFQALEFPQSFSIFNMERSTLASRRNQNFLHVIPLVLLMIIGAILAILSVALSDPGAPAVPGSKIALRVAVYVPLFAFCYTIILAIRYITTAERKWPGGTEPPRGVPSHLVPRDRRWCLLPGGDEYGVYRKQRVKEVI